ncbi:MAG: alanine--tRNA ligase [Acidobacteriota bacterium]
MNSQDIRQSFLDYFERHGHRPTASAPLVPHGDATLLFVNAGMVPFKDYFLGAAAPPAPRAVSVQKCLRVSGKHNDLENVGPSPRHHTFFEMLGNFSFGGYFKEEAIRRAWELVTEVWELPAEHLFASVFHEDDEAFDLWKKLSTLPEGRIQRCGAKDNFWSMGETGPCGPSSEIFVDLTPDLPLVDWEEGDASGRYLEIWNLVFMQFDRDASGALNPLPSPSVDTGAGLERVTSVLAGVSSNYDTDLFQPILRAAATLAGTEYRSETEDGVSLRVIADHLRAVTFLLADGVIPSNEGRGYVLRRVLRRALRHGLRLGFEEPFLHRLVPVLGEVMGKAYPELGATEEASVGTVQAEEGKFLSTLASGARQVQDEIETAKQEGRSELAGPQVFRLYDTHGLPIEVLREIAEEERMALDEAGFENELQQQRARSRQSSGGGQQRLARLRQVLAEGGEEEETEFIGYRQLELAGVPVEKTLVLEGDAVSFGPIATGQRGVLVVDRTPFYAESGGQVGDRGRIAWPEGSASVTDTQKDRDRILHYVEVEEGTLEPGVAVDLQVSPEHRLPTQRNHTATHLLHAALREELGDGVRQAGSLVAPDRLRFDFTHGRPLSGEEKDRIAGRVNDKILEAQEAVIVGNRDFDEAVAAGAMALFGEKYGDRVRTVEIPGFSLELCGGCHVGNTGEIGPFVLTSERGTASGVRRIEAVTGRDALDLLRGRDRQLAAAEAFLGVSGERVADEIGQLKARLKASADEMAKLRMEMLAGPAEDDGAREVAGLQVLTKEVPPAPANELRNMADTLRGKIGSGVVVLGTRQDGKVTLIVAVTPDLTDRVAAGALVRRLAPMVGGGGGGRPDFAQAGGKEPEKLDALLAAAPDAVREELGD